MLRRHISCNCFFDCGQFVGRILDTACLIVFDGDKSAFRSVIYCGLPSTYAADEVCLMNVLRVREYAEEQRRLIMFMETSCSELNRTEVAKATVAAG